MDRIHDTTSLDNAVAYIIHRTARLLRFDLSKFFQAQDVEISPEQWFVLFRLYEHPGLSQSELADKALNDHPNITRMLDGLEKQELVQREPDPDDRRRSLVYLSPRGADLVQTLFPLVIEERKRIFADISAAEVESLVRILGKLEHNVTTQA